MGSSLVEERLQLKAEIISTGGQNYGGVSGEKYG